MVIIAYLKILIGYITETTPKSSKDYIYLTVDKCLYVVYYLYLMIAFRPKRFFKTSDLKTNESENIIVEMKENIENKENTNETSTFTINDDDNEEKVVTENINEEIKNVVVVGDDDDEIKRDKNDVFIEIE